MWQDSELVSAEIFTPHHRYAGRVATRGNRLADFLNDPTTELVEMRGVCVSQARHAPSSEKACEQLMLKKQAIVIAIPTGTYEAPARRLYGYVEKQHYTAHVVVPGYYLIGTVHMPARPNLWSLVNEGGTTPSFVPITNVAIRCATGDVEPLHAKVAIFRRQVIEALFLTDKPEATEAIHQAVAELKDMRVEDLLRTIEELKPAELAATEPATSDANHARDALVRVGPAGLPYLTNL
jgi:hypothetical protein